MVTLRSILAVLLLAASWSAFAGEEDYYEIQDFDPGEYVLEVSGILQLKNGKIMICTRRGEVFVVENAFEPAKATFTPWAFGLSHPLGLYELNGWIYTVQRGEVTRMKDSTGDGKADLFETVNDEVPISGNYHEYNFGPRLDKEGKLWITTNKPFGGEPYGGHAKFRGWALRFDPDTGKMETMACGLRSPAGMEISPAGDVFYTDNQGEWCNASKLSHIEKNDFHGHPHGIASAKEPESTVTYPGEVKSGSMMKDLHLLHPTFKMPAVWFPYKKMGQSPAGMAWDTATKGEFGPFAGQLFVGDQHHSTVMRVFLEKIDGHWQGACFRFREGFQCGIIRVTFGKDHSMFVGMTNSGWGSAGNKPWGIQRLIWKKKLPFEIHEMHAKPDGFELTFTEPVDPAGVADLANYNMISYTYRLRSNYGGPEENTRPVAIKSATLSADGKTVKLTIDQAPPEEPDLASDDAANKGKKDAKPAAGDDKSPVGLRLGYVHELILSNFKSTTGQALLHPEAYYTLVNIPK